MNARLRIFMATLLLAGASSAWGSIYSCTGTIDFIGLSPAGIVTVGSQSSWLMGFYVCQIGVSTNGVGLAQLNAQCLCK